LAAGVIVTGEGKNIMLTSYIEHGSIWIDIGNDKNNMVLVMRDQNELQDKCSRTDDVQE
jgi:hypothetical protein